MMRRLLGRGRWLSGGIVGRCGKMWLGGSGNMERIMEV